MNFTFCGSYHGGSRNTPLSMEVLRNAGANPSVFTSKYYFNSRLSTREEKKVVEPIWQYYIFYNNVEVYWIDSEMPYYITEEEVLPTIEQCEYIVRETYKRLQEVWEKRKQSEANFFPSVPEITTKALDLAVQDLMKTLLDEPASPE